MKKSALLFLVFFTIQVSAQQKSVLFLGNSYTATSNLPATLYSLAAAGGDTIIHDRNTPGGYTLEGHSTNATSLSKIASSDWDFVVLQEQSQKPSFPPSQVAAETYPFADALVDSIKSNYECSEPVFFMTWGRRDGDQQNCQFYSPLCTFEGMNARLRESYLEMGQDNNATVAPCGAAWKYLSEIDNTAWTGLYSGDGSHPSAKGTYLNACVFYATIFRQSPVGIPYYSNIGQQDAQALQQLAEDIVIDSLTNWYIGHQDVSAIANFSSDEGLSVNFSNQSENANSHFWDFGDGNDATEPNPQHTFASPSTYQVQYIAYSDCGADTSYLEVNVSPFSTGVNDRNDLDEIKFLLQNEGTFQVKNPTDRDVIISIYDQLGKLIASNTATRRSGLNMSTGSLSGLFLIVLDDGGNRLARKFAIVR